VSSPYEPPESPELVVHTGEGAVDDCLSELMAYVERAFAPER
jgi:adenylylsulfate kinase-like enzyme